ncbi:MAG: prenyltransferase [Candidatus Thermoplasmatota archaeon]|nr:prenyltransferase [Candidatus Thermoplasmatota archaeon]MBS3801990.1 prenyltransferase [Candidatus Thermoplasmatota archaeon]
MSYTLRTTILSWWQASRYHFIPPSMFPAAIGTIVSWASFQSFSLYFFVLVILGVIINHAALNMTDDYFDYKHAVDSTKPGEENPYTGGSKTLTSGLIEPKKMFIVFSILYGIVFILGLYITIERGILVLAFGLIGILSSIFYTSPPVKFAHHGFGELGLLLNFGPVIGLGAFYVQSQQLSIEAFLATIPCGIMLFSMIVINEIPDIQEDRLAGKLTLVARFGKKAGMRLYIISWIATYSIIIFSVLLSFIPWPILISLFSLPLVIDSNRLLVQHYKEPAKLINANKRMIQAHAITSFGIIIGYIWHGYTQGKPVTEITLFLLVLLVLYVPALIPPFQTKLEKK